MTAHLEPPGSMASIKWRSRSLFSTKVSGMLPESPLAWCPHFPYFPSGVPMLPSSSASSAHESSLSPAAASPSFREAFWFWLKLGFISFGGPTGQIAIMHTELVERRRWLTENRFLQALNFCMLLPGPEAQQLAIYAGWSLHRTLGGIVAGVLFVLPAALLLWVLSWVYVSFGQLGWITGIFYALKPAVLAIVIHAVWRIGSRVLKTPLMWTVAALAFGAIFLLALPFPAILLSAGFFGWIISRWAPQLLPRAQGHGAAPGVACPPASKATWGRALRIVVLGVTLWWVPILAAGWFLGWEGTIFREGVFFSKAAMVTFGGAYAVLPYVSQQAVENYAWLSAAQMLDGLALAESTPGPLIIVLQFVGFLGGWHHPGDLPPLVAATLGAIITTWATFVPCFLWIFLGAPHVDHLHHQPRLSAALSAITAAVVGVVLNLAVWFGYHILLPEGNVDWWALGIAAGALWGLGFWKWGVIPLVLGAGALGALGSWIW